MPIAHCTIIRSVCEGDKAPRWQGDKVSDEWMVPQEWPLNRDQFHRLPRSPAYRYEFLQGKVWISGRPHYYHALLDLTTVAAEVSGREVVRPVVEHDWEAMPPLFAAAFGEQPPYITLTEEARLEAATRSLTTTRTGGDGPLITSASFVAEEKSARVGAILVTLLPEADPTGWHSYQWDEPPPEDCIVRRLGRPHLTWIFVAPRSAGRGVGTALLTAAAAGLRQLGYTEMASTFLLGNHSSMLWHWRNGFRLLSYSGSRRLWT
jgi:GNAT superfamily N-acetyltransferase